ncbi:MAG: hypothetical protein K8Q97_01485 [Candidatus Andersenbacteria bacterium]|nr:hypothetical protein [Candidatus Andersenbacteria bacterium]
MYNAIGIDADIGCNCGTGMPIIAEKDTGKWCWWHGERKTQTWFLKSQLSHEATKHNLHFLQEPIPFELQASKRALFASTDFLDFNHAVLPVFFNGSRCKWGCLASQQPPIIVTYASWKAATRWLDDLARMTVHTIDRRLQHPWGVAHENDTLRNMADIALRIAEDTSIKLNLHVRICAGMMENTEINQYFCDHVEGAFWNIDSWEFEKMMYAYIQNIQNQAHFFQQ